MSIVYKLQGDGRDSWVITHSDNHKEVVFDFEVDLWRLKAILDEDGLINNVNGVLNSLTGVDKIRGGYAWQHANTIKFSSNLTQNIILALGLTKEQAVDIFIRAKELEV